MNNNDKKLTTKQALIVSIVIGLLITLVLSYAQLVADGYKITNINDYLIYIPIAIIATIIFFIVIKVAQKEMKIDKDIKKSKQYSKPFVNIIIAYKPKQILIKNIYTFICLILIFSFISYLEDKKIDIEFVISLSVICGIIGAVNDWIVYYFKPKKEKLYLNDKLSNEDLNKNKTYFREILNDYNPIELSYIDDFILDYPKDIIVTLLSLKHKEKITLDENTDKIIINDKNINLTNSERIVLDNIKNGKVDKNIKNKLLESVQQECLEKQLIKSSNKTLADYLIKGLILIPVLIALIIGIIYLLSSGIINDSFIFILISISLVALFFIIPQIISIVFDYSIMNAEHPYNRTELGEEINKRLEGLKNYLKDFSNLDESKTKDLVIWEEYLMYSVLFNQNTDILNEMYNRYFEIEKDFYND